MPENIPQDSASGNIFSSKLGRPPLEIPRDAATTFRRPQELRAAEIAKAKELGFSAVNDYLNWVSEKEIYGEEYANKNRVRRRTPRSYRLDTVPALASLPNQTAPQVVSTGNIGRASEVREGGPNLWAPLRAALAERVSEQNFEIWLSSVRFLSSNEERLVLQVPNSYFQEYLSEHYTEVVQEVLLNQCNMHREIEWVVPGEVAEAPQEKPVVAIVAPAPVQLPDPRTEEELELRFIEEEQAILDERVAIERQLSQAARSQFWSFVQQRDVRNQYKAAQDLEDRKRAIEKKRRHAALMARLSFATLTQPGTPQTHRQYEPRSAWATEGGATRQDRAALVRSFRRPGKPKDSS